MKYYIDKLNIVAKAYQHPIIAVNYLHIFLRHTIERIRSLPFYTFRKFLYQLTRG